METDVTNESIPIVFSCGNYYARFAAVAIESIAFHASLSRHYDIVVLHTDISTQTQEMMRETVTGKPNVTLRFMDLSGEIPEVSEPAHIHASVETYNRLCAHKFFARYNKIVYLDSDIVVCRDISGLMDAPLGNCLLGAVRDVDHAGLYRGNVGGVGRYTDRVLQLSDPYAYFQAGVLLMNIGPLQAAFGEDGLIKKAGKSYMFVDQDILNMACQGNIKHLDMRWNVLVGSHRRKRIAPLAPSPIFQDYERSYLDPWIVHYAGAKKPWRFPEDDFSDIYREHASRTPFYGLICEEYARSQEAYKKKRVFYAAKTLASTVKYGIIRMKTRK
ncbi:MAG: glycosyltransferase family 8 protein [Clostridium sp.]|nr:glycosyltransferase family 8 protein [Clostridium sp.]